MDKSDLENHFAEISWSLVFRKKTGIGARLASRGPSGEPAELEKNETIMSEALEALLIAIYSDMGLGKAREVLEEVLP